MPNSEMQSIAIDIDVHKIIVANMEGFGETPNDVLRKLLGLPVTRQASSAPNGLVTQGTILPEGLELSKIYKGEKFTARIRNGKILFNGEPYTSPSGAACAATSGSVNGWTFWEYQDLDGKTHLLDHFRK